MSNTYTAKITQIDEGSVRVTILTANGLIASECTISGSPELVEIQVDAVLSIPGLRKS